MFRVAWRSIRDVFDELFLLIGVNLCWALINLPLIGLAFLISLGGNNMLAAAILLLEALVLGPSNAGLYTIALRVTESRTSKISTFFGAFREYATWSWKIYGIWMAGLVLVLVNLVFYANLGSTIGLFLMVVFLYILAVWLVLLIYIGPLMILQHDRRLRTLGRNAMLMAFGRPLFTLVTAILMLLLVVLSSIVPLLLVLVSVALLAVWSMRATQHLIADAETRRLEREQQAALPNNASAEKGRGGQIKPRQ